MVDQKVLIAYVTQEYARRADFYDYLNLMIKPASWLMLPCHDRSPAKGRNLIIEAAKEHKCTHILFMDDDMAPREDALMRLLQHDVDIVSGLYLARMYPHQPLAFDIADDSDSSCLYMYLTDDTHGLREVVAAGLGFCLVRTAIFDKLEKPYIRLGELSAEDWCDDIGFFNRVRKAGIKSYVDTDCKVGHIGTMIIWPNVDNGKWFTGYDTSGPGHINIPQIIPTGPDIDEFMAERIEKKNRMRKGK